MVEARHQFHQTLAKSEWWKAQSCQHIAASQSLASGTNFKWKCFVKWLFKAAFCNLHEKAARNYVDEIEAW
jgi:hypothetical protein